MCIIDRIHNEILSNGAIKERENVLVAFSGGADSVSLLFILNELKKKLDFSLKAIHVNHMIRSDASDDEIFTKEFCEKRGIEFFSYLVDVPEFCRENKLSEEEGARILRYKKIYECCDENNIDKVAVAHNMNDNAETIFMNILRGTGINGLIGIRRVNGKVIRPLLNVARSQIEEICRENNLEYCTDITNSNDEYTRNNIRNNVFPYINDKTDVDIVAKLNDLSDVLEDDFGYLNKQTDLAYLEVVREDDEVIKIDIEKFLKLHNSLKKRVIISCVNNVCGRLKDIERGHIVSILNLLEMDSGKEIHLPYNLVARKSFDEIEIFERENKRNVFVNLDLNDETLIEDAKISILVEKIDKEMYNNVLRTSKKCIDEIFLDSDKIKENIVVRNREDGDVFKSINSSSSKKLKKFFGEIKLSIRERNSVLLLADGKDIIWIIGIRESDSYKVDHDTVNILRIKVKEDGGR